MGPHRLLASSALALGLSLTGLPAVGEEPLLPKPRPVQLVEVFAPTPALRSRLADLGLDLAEHATEQGVQAILHGPDDAELLRSAGFDWDVLVPDLVTASRERDLADAAYARRVDRSPLPSGRTSYRTLADYEADMRRLAEDNPGLVRLFELPHPSLEGRTVFGIEVASHVNAKDGRPVFLLMGLHHAREWPSGEHTLEFAFDLVKNYGREPKITRLVDRVRTIFVPVVNPDGFFQSRTFPHTDLKRKNCRLVDGLPAPQPLCSVPPAPAGIVDVGVDLNRNYGGFWGGNGSSNAPVTQTYRGPAPFSEPESENIRELVSERHVVVLITNHTSGRLILRPPGQAAVGQVPEEEILKTLGDEMASRNGYRSQHGWELYDTTGTTEDWSYFATGGLGYTFEMMTQFHPSFASVVAEYGEKNRGNRGAFMVALEAAADPELHSVITGRAPKGAVLRLMKEFDTPTSQNLVVEDRLETTMVAGSRFVWHVYPSTRPLEKAEKWTLTCERHDGTVLQTIRLRVDRGDQAKVNLGTCIRQY